jgi:hypothetical protein
MIVPSGTNPSGCAWTLNAALPTFIAFPADAPAAPVPPAPACR